MSFLTLNGVTINCSVDAKFEPVRLGDTTRSLNGEARRSWRASKREWSLRTPPMSASDAEPTRKFLDGEGHAISFVDSSSYTSKGLAPSTFTNWSFGPSSLLDESITATGSASARWDFALGDDCTAIVWRYDGSDWHHYIVRSDGAKWLDGVRADATSTSFLDLTSTYISVNGTAGVQYDEIVALPFLVLESWATDIYDFHLDNAWGSLPFHVLNGSIANDDDTTALAEVVGVSPVQVGSSIYQSIEFTLREV